jgi:hypothetical protein
MVSGDMPPEGRPLLPYEQPDGAELRFGDPRLGYVDADMVVQLSQVRHGPNDAYGGLLDSIRERNLLNPINVAYVTREQLAEYIGFTNEVWRADARIEQFDHMQLPDGRFILLIAGHTRMAAIRVLHNEAIAQARARQQPPPRCIVQARFHDVEGPEDVVGAQLDENLHTQPAPENIAMAVAETYLRGVRLKMWDSKAAFRRHVNGKISRHFLDQALAFVDLPPQARNFVFANKLPYRVGVALGHAAPVFREDEALRMGRLFPDAPEIVRALELRVGTAIAHIVNNGLRGARAYAYIDRLVGEARDHIEREKRGTGGFMQDALPLILGSPEEQLQEHMRHRVVEYRRELAALARLSIDDVAGVLRLHVGLFGAREMDALLTEQNLRQRVLGQLAMADLPLGQGNEW